jgi:hypothetical protein
VGESNGGDVRVPAMVSSVSNNNGDETASFPLSPMLVSIDQEVRVCLASFLKLSFYRFLLGEGY